MNGLAGWIDQAHKIDRRRWSAARYRAIDRHGAAFPLDAIQIEADRAALTEARLMICGNGRHWNRAFERPIRGHRRDHWTTPALMAVNNQLARLGPGNH